MTILVVLPLEDEGLPFAHEMLYEAAFWRSTTQRPPIDDALQQPELALYLDGWGRHGDHGLIAHVRNQPAGAVWVRRFHPYQHGYGYIDDQTPELTVAVAEPFRRRGIARGLISVMIAHQRLLGTTRLSLSVEDDNPARTLYEQLGFTVHHAEGGARTMTLTFVDVDLFAERRWSYRDGPRR